jgi:hypothetical protein
MRLRKLLARVLVPAALAFTALGPTAGEANAMPVCWTLNYHYERYEASTNYWYERYSTSRKLEDLAMAQYFDTLRIATAQMIMQEGC